MSASSKTITASVVAELRRKTGAGMMDCKQALTQAEGNVEKAVELLRKKGKATAQKRADRSANEGLVMAAVSSDGHHAALVEINSETDFVARNAEFQAFVKKVVTRILEWEDGNGKQIDELLALSSGTDRTIGNELTDLIGTIGEKLVVRRFARMTDDAGLISSYIHSNSKLGVLVDIEGVDIGEEEHQMLAKDISMQVAAAMPLFVHRQEIPEDKLAVEKEIIAEQVKTQGKPPQLVEKIVSGKLNKYFSEVCLVDQPFIKDSNVKVGDLVAQAAQKSEKPIAIRLFVRFQIGG